MRYLLALICFFPTWILLAQDAGDMLFDTDQVIEMRFTFPDDDFYLQMAMNYQAGEESTISATLEITDLSGTYLLDSVAVRFKGNSSYDFHPTQKKPLKVDLDKHVAGQEYHGLKKLNLANGWSDPTLLREKVFFDACRREGVLAPRMNFANVYLNDMHWGVYGVIEQVDKNFLDRWIGENNGNLFKAGDNYSPDGGGLGLEADLNHYGPNASNYTGRYELKTNNIENDWSDLIGLLDLIDNSTNAELQAGLPESMELPTLLRSLAMDNLFGNMDAYYGTARNYYLYHDSSTFKWHWIKWDANMSFGRYVPQWVNDVAALPATYTTPGRRLLQRVMAIPALRQAYLIEYCAVMENFTNAELDPRIDALHDLLLPHVSVDNNMEYSSGLFTLNINQTVTAQSGQWWNTIPGLKSFIAERRANLLASSLNCATVGLEEFADAPALLAYPNPTSGILFVDLPIGSSINDLRLMDVVGRQLEVKISGNSIDLSQHPSGLYIVQLLGENGAISMRVEKL